MNSSLSLEGIMNSQKREISSWKIVSELMRRFPNKFTVIEAHPSGGTYDCLSLYSAKKGFIPAKHTWTHAERRF